MESVVFNVSPENFQTEVVERSNSVPVLLLFWADQVPPSVQTKQQLEQLLGQYQGKALLGVCDVAQDQTLAQHLQVRGLPALRVVQQGKIVEQVDGPVDEQQMRMLLDTLTQSPAEQIKAQLQQIIAMGDFATAVQMLQQAVNEEPGNQAFRVELADVLVRKGDLEDARTVLASIPEDTDERDRPQNRLEFAEEAAGMEDLAQLQQQLGDAPDDLELIYQHCVQSVAAGEFEQGLQDAMRILSSDREFRDDIGRLTMIRIFAVLGKGNAMATQYRRKMFNFMH
ncbi:MAG: tetratricopeptide repeat protein [Pseudomonadota bacterium]